MKQNYDNTLEKRVWAPTESDEPGRSARFSPELAKSGLSFLDVPS